MATPEPVTEVLAVTEELPAPEVEALPVFEVVTQLPNAGDEPLFDARGFSPAQSGFLLTTPPSNPGVRPVARNIVKMPPAQRIMIPSIGLDSKIVHLGLKQEKGSWTWETPDHAVGHHVGTANPNEGSNAVYSGHISSPIKGEGSIFKLLPEVKVGDQVFMESVLGMSPYVVDEVKLVQPDDLSVMYPTSSETVTLITCYPDLVYSYRLVVVAKPAIGGSDR